jgi:hypothetical protein
LRIQSLLERYPDAEQFAILIGTNDTGGTMPRPSGLGCSGSSCDGTYKSYMQSLVDTVTAAGKTPVVALVPPRFDEDPSEPFSDPNTATKNVDYIQEYNSVIRNELDNIIVGPDFYQCYLGYRNRFSLFFDNLHPNGLGSQVMALLWQDAIVNGAPVAGSPCPAPRFILDNVAPYDYEQNLLETGDTFYIDRDYTLGSIPSELENGIWIMTAEDDAGATSSNFLSFDIDRDAGVYVAYDSRATSLPNWMSGFAASGMQIPIVGHPQISALEVYQADYSAGTVTLGGNQAIGSSGAGSNYIVIVVER